MRMSVGIFWGIVLVVIGLSIIAKVAFNISFIRIAVGALLILLGLKILLARNSFSMNPDNGTNFIFTDKSIDVAQHPEPQYNVLFSNIKLDFAGIDSTMAGDNEYTINGLFCNIEVYVNEKQPVTIRSNTLFGYTRLPDNNSVVFGTMNYSTKEVQHKKNKLNLVSNILFAQLTYQKNKAI
jgi:hypothetical protein